MFSNKAAKISDNLCKHYLFQVNNKYTRKKRNWLLDMLDNDNIITKSDSEAVEKIWKRLSQMLLYVF